MKSAFIFKILVLLLMFSGFFTHSQIVHNNILSIDTVNGKVGYVGIVNISNMLTAEQIYNSTKEWFSSDITKFQIASSEKGSATNDAVWGTKKADMQAIDLQYNNDSPLIFEDPVSRKIIGKVVCKYFGSSYGCVRLVYLTFEIKVQTKDGKYKYDVSNFDYVQYNHYTAMKMPFGGMSDKGFCKSSGSIEELLWCENCVDKVDLMLRFLDAEVNTLIKDLETHINSTKVTSDW